MSDSSLFECLQDLELRMNEIHLIINNAEKIEDSDSDFYATLCRAAQVLLSSHFEGYLREVITKIINDINDSGILFNQINNNIQRDYCKNLVHFNENDKNSKENNNKIENLQKVLGSLQVNISPQFIAYAYNENENPKTQYIDRLAKLFSLKDIFKDLEYSIASNVFLNTYQENIILLDKLKSNIYYWSSCYPYLSSKDYLEINIPDNQNKTNLWGSFIDLFLKRRHDIVHGRETNNTVGHTEILHDLIKINILLIAYTILISFHANPINQQCFGSSLENMIDSCSPCIINKVEIDLNMMNQGKSISYKINNISMTKMLNYSHDLNIFNATIIVMGEKYTTESESCELEVQFSFNRKNITDGNIPEIFNIKLLDELITQSTLVKI